MWSDSSRFSTGGTRKSIGSNANRRPVERQKVVKRSIEDKGTNIQVVLRCRGRNEQEIAANSPVIVEPKSKREVTLRLANKESSYSFDRVFGPEITQQEIYDEVAQPILDEMLLGYNCTIFAYGQTGTGKTYTMEGDLEERDGGFSSQAGIIPRAVTKLFETLDNQGADYSVKVSLIELYNEELRDLLGQSNDNRALRIFEDQNGRGVIVQGMEESLISSASEALDVMQRGNKNRSIAATRCNDKSSRSHCIFTLTVHIKETLPEGEDVLKVGKLNLVDLAGSENINRSGAEYTRAREAGMINQSLLTLGRVINQLVDHAQHVPYRESKLTRLLKDSLGGRTKTCIIATISVAKMNQEEIISTLDYAKRAKNIRNRPEANQRMNPRVLLREYEMTIERLKADLRASREQNGVYLSQQSYSLLTDENQSSKDRIVELTRDIKAAKDTLDAKRKELEEKTKLLLGKESELEDIQGKLKRLNTKLERQIAEFSDRISQYTNGSMSAINSLLSSLEANTDIMHALTQEGIRAQNEFADKMERIRIKLREESEQKCALAEKAIASFFDTFEEDLSDINAKIIRIEKHFEQMYKNHMQGERQYIEHQTKSLMTVREDTMTTLSEERERAEKERSSLQADLQDNLSTVMDDVIKQGTDRLDTLHRAEKTIVDQKKMLADMSSGLTSLHEQGRQHKQNVLQAIEETNQVITTSCDEISQQKPLLQGKRPLPEDSTTNVSNAKRQKNTS
ncbi:hypothetical protein O0I10_010157 [Lichtheimia ornata]|uniref:Kinesin-like protein n=1 Tax=Lichtheimia ornata TaxID=688661 RepID=A0AAD7UWN1_9FUNG|nr:uncharacterized protein O0I10_010157 [Lichtheimia ornata]KAJ8654209.1 hypothetical protein O0I10_010157 [Lichtheimia ornata]